MAGKMPAPLFLIRAFTLQKRRGHLVVLVLVAIGAPALFVAAGKLGTPTAANKRTEPLKWGYYFLNWRRQFARDLTNDIKRFASPPDYVMYYTDLKIPYRRDRNDAIRALGAVPVLSLELTRWHRGADGYLEAIIAGDYDTFFRDWATAAKADGKRVLLRFGFEFNGDWFNWGGKPKRFIAAWRHTHAIFRDVGADNVEWVWSPNIVSIPRDAKNSMHHYYPGDAFVDCVGVDGYNFGDHHDEWHKWESFETVYREFLTKDIRRYPDKPIIITEFGCAPGDGDQRAQWFRDAYAYLQRFPRVKGVIVFEIDKRSEGEPNWRLRHDDGSLSAFNETFAAPPQPRDRKR